MADADFSLRQRDKLRYVKDRIARCVVKGSGIAILAAIVIIFFYLVTIVLPIFYSAKVSLISEYTFEVEEKEVAAIRIDDYGENAMLFTHSGELQYIRFEAGAANLALSTQVMMDPVAFATSVQSQGWFAYANRDGEIVAVKPSFNVSFSSQGRVLTPDLQVFDESAVILSQASDPIKQFAFTIQAENALFVAQTESGKLKALQLRIATEWQNGQAAWTSKPITLPRFPDHIDQIKVSPDGRQLFVLSGNELMVAHLESDRFVVREFVDLSRGNANKQVDNIRFLSGAYSILVTHKDNTVSQWFDVLKSGERVFTRIREFELEAQSQLIVTDTYRKGFYSFSSSGMVQGFYTTSENSLFSDTIYNTAPHVAALSDNESFLIALMKNEVLTENTAITESRLLTENKALTENKTLAEKQTLSSSKIVTHHIDNAYPEVSLSSLWRKVWYENYPEPQYVWQSTSANNDFEAKFSLVPITFGTLKATFFAMLFAVPIAVSGAIYTAYFMSSPMRKVVKPAIEIMEALPTVVIGFLAGLWLAPIVETHLTGVVVLLVALPFAVIVMAIIWSGLPAKITQSIPKGWHVMTLIPVTILTGYLCVTFSASIEAWWFGGDIRLYLAGLGISYDQRNAFIVGVAMGFAVIPTIFTIAEDAIYSVPRHLSDGSLALGATQWQTLIYVVLLTASPGIFSAIMIGLGRAVGETMIVLMATGNTPIMDVNIFEGMRSLAATIAVEMPESEVGDTHYRLLFLAALVLFVFTFVVNSVAEIVRQRLKERYSSM